MHFSIKSNRWALWSIAIGLVVLIVSVMGWSGLSSRDPAVPVTGSSGEDFFAEDSRAVAKKQLVVSRAMVQVMIDASLSENPSLRENLPELREQFERGLVAQEMMVAEAIDMGLAASDPIVRNRLNELIMLGIYQQADALLTEEAVREYYESNRHKYVLDEKRLVRHLFVRVTNVTDEDMALTTLGRLFKEATGPESRRPEAVKDAIVPLWVTREEVRSRFGPTFTEWLFSLPTGDWSDPKRSTSGWHRVRVLEESPQRQREFEEVEAEVESDLRQKLRLDAYLEEMDRLSRKYNVTIAD